MSIQDIRARLDARLIADEVANIAFVQQMTRIPSENPPGDTTKLAKFLSGWLTERMLEHRIEAPVPEWPNIVASFEGATPGKHLILNGHLDVFPGGDATQWSDDPFSGNIVDGKLYGRGVIDMKTGTAASFLTFMYLHELREHLAGRLTLTAVSDEETGGTWGTKYLLENFPDETLGDCVLNGEPSTPQTIRIGEKGPLWIEVLVRTTGGHGAYTHVSGNAIKESAAIIAQLESLTELPVEMPPDVLKRVEEAREALDFALGAGATDIVKQVTVNVGLIDGGVKMNVIAADCRTQIDLRAPVGVTSATLLERFEDVLKAFPNASYTIHQATEPSVCTPDHEMVRILQRNAVDARGIRPFPTIGIGGTDCRFWRWRGIPAYVYGPTPYNMGAPNEYVTLDDLLGTVRVHVLSAFDYLTGVSE